MANKHVRIELLSWWIEQGHDVSWQDIKVYLKSDAYVHGRRWRNGDLERVLSLQVKALDKKHVLYGLWIMLYLIATTLYVRWLNTWIWNNYHFSTPLDYLDYWRTRTQLVHLETGRRAYREELVQVAIKLRKTAMGKWLKKLGLYYVLMRTERD